MFAKLSCDNTAWCFEKLKSDCKFNSSTSFLSGNFSTMSLVSRNVCVS